MTRAARPPSPHLAPQPPQGALLPMKGGVSAEVPTTPALDDTQSSASAPNPRPRSVRSECVRRAKYVRELASKTT